MNDSRNALDAICRHILSHGQLFCATMLHSIFTLSQSQYQLLFALLAKSKPGNTKPPLTPLASCKMGVSIKSDDCGASGHGYVIIVFAQFSEVGGGKKWDGINSFYTSKK